jgi:hypothetical protein
MKNMRMRNTNLNSWTLKKYQIEQAKEEKKTPNFLAQLLHFSGAVVTGGVPFFIFLLLRS